LAHTGRIVAMRQHLVNDYSQAIRRPGSSGGDMPTLIALTTAAAAEIAGCFAFWAVVRNGASAIWLAPGVASLIAFAWLLTKVDVAFAGRAYAVYGGIYIAASLMWMWSVEGRAPDRWDVIGAGVAIVGATIILYAPRAA
jgi:small multidrug resistance family-3 protein